MERQNQTPPTGGHTKISPEHGPPKKRGKSRRSGLRISSGEKESNNRGTPARVVQRPDVCGKEQPARIRLSFDDICVTTIPEPGTTSTSSGSGSTRTDPVKESSEFITLAEVLEATHQRVKGADRKLPKPFERSEGQGTGEQEETHTVQVVNQKRPQEEFDGSETSSEANCYRNFKGVSGAVIDTKTDNIENAIDLDMLIAGDLEFDNEVSTIFQ